MASTLFRHQAVQASADAAMGVPMALMPRSWWALTGFFLAIAAGTLGFLATASFPRKEAASGILRFSRGEIRVTPPRSGIVTTLHVRDGEAVAEGDLLAFITTEQRLAEGGIVDARILAAVAAERQHLRQRLERLNESEPLQAASLRQRIAGLTVQLDELTQDRASRAQALKLARESLAVALAAQGIYSAEQRRQREQAMLALEQSVIELKSQMANMESQRADLALQLLWLPVARTVATTRAITPAMTQTAKIHRRYRWQGCGAIYSVGG